MEIALGIARWVGLRAARLNDSEWQALLETEFGGMQEALGELYRRTEDPEPLRLARLFDQRAVFDPLSLGEDRLNGLHANTQVPKAIGAALGCELTGEPRYCAVARTFWERVARYRSYVIGGHSEYEHFSPVAHFSRHLGVKTAETCNTYNMLKLTRLLFQLDADPARIDFYERALFNHILPRFSPLLAERGETFPLAVRIAIATFGGSAAWLVLAALLSLCVAVWVGLFWKPDKSFGPNIVITACLMTLLLA